MGAISQYFCETCNTWLSSRGYIQHINDNPNHIAVEKIRYVEDGLEHDIDSAAPPPPPIIETIKKYCIKEYSTNKKKLQKETWYETDNGDGTYSDKIEETEYVYDGNKIVREEVTMFWPDGSERDSYTVTYFTQEGNKVVKKKKN